jgi:transglutaminase-like putative cysteine protease
VQLSFGVSFQNKIREMKQYLESSNYIDWKTPQILEKANDLSKGVEGKEALAKACFEYVRDEIKHSWDFELNPVTSKASDVLKHGTGYCYAKSHLLAALLRANDIPAGLCYQRVTISDVPPFCLHGLNAIYLQNYGWYRVDARGNKEGVDAEFCPPIEKLAFPIVAKGEMTLPEIWAEPLEMVIKTLKINLTWSQVAENLPDIEIKS